MKSDIDNYYLSREEPAKSTLLALREIILKQDGEITEEWKYRMPFFCYKGKMFCYLWTKQRTGQPYLGIVEGKKIGHPDLQMEERSRMKILPLDPRKDLPLRTIESILTAALSLYKMKN